MDHREHRRLSHDLQGLAVLAAAIVIVAVILLRNNGTSSSAATETQTASPVSVAVIQATATPQGSWREAISAGLTEAPPSSPTIYIPRPTVTLPATLSAGQMDAITPTPDGAILWSATATPAMAVTSNGPTRAAPTPVAMLTEGPDVRYQNNPRLGEFSLPPEQVPRSSDPRDHFYFRRPVNASANSTQLFFYAYGSDGPQNEWRIHHGIDLPNPIGKEVLAAGPGRVIWAGDNYRWYENGRRIESAYTYGNVIIIEHDFGYEGQRLYTLYAHLQAILVTEGDRVVTSQIIGLSGRSGVVSGPHVHFEVRIGQNWYFATRNPILWMAPYDGHGVVAGRILWPNGQPIADANVLLTRNGKTIDSTTTYVNPKWLNQNERTVDWNVVPDDVWRENFVFGDVPAGEYTIVVLAGGKRYEKQVSVRPATTSFVDFGQGNFAPTPVG